MKSSSCLGLLLSAGLLLGGCAAAQKPCPIIPAQLELAEERTEMTEDDYQTASEDLGRIHDNLDRLMSNITKLEEEKEILLELTGGDGEEEEE